MTVRSAQYAGHDANADGSRIAGRRRASGRRLLALSATGFNSLGTYADELRLTRTVQDQRGRLVLDVKTVGQDICRPWPAVYELGDR